MAQSSLRYKRLLNIIARDPSMPVYVAAMEAGFTEQTSRKQGKRLIESALKWQAAESKKENTSGLLNTHSTVKELKQKIHERVGLTSEQLMENVKHLVLQTKDYGVRLKVLRSLLKDMEDPIDIDPDSDQKVIMPVLNITMGKREDAINTAYTERTALVLPEMPQTEQNTTIDSE